MSFTARFSPRRPLAMIAFVLAGTATAAGSGGLVDIGEGRKMYLQCSGVG